MTSADMTGKDSKRPEMQHRRPQAIEGAHHEQHRNRSRIHQCSAQPSRVAPVSILESQSSPRFDLPAPSMRTRVGTVGARGSKWDHPRRPSASGLTRTNIESLSMS